MGKEDAICPSGLKTGSSYSCACIVGVLRLFFCRVRTACLRTIGNSFFLFQILMTYYFANSLYYAVMLYLFLSVKNNNLI